MTVREAAKQYIDFGWRVVPLAPGEKACKDADWKKLIFQPDDFRNDDNIGIMWVDGFVDIDLDSPECVQLARQFLPDTGCIYGRESKPASHWLYRCRADKAYKFLDLVIKEVDERKATLVELRYDHQSMAPPSTHPSGETVRWDVGPGPVAEVELEPLLRSIRLLATAGLLSRYYNPPGQRHDWGVALAGGFRALGLTEPEALKVMEVSAAHVNDTKVEDRFRSIRDTYAKSDDDPVKGMKALEESMQSGKLFVASIRKIWGADTSGMTRSMLQMMNEKHAVIFQQSGDLVVITEDRDLDNRPFLRFSDPATIRNLYPQPVQVGTTARGAPIFKPLGEAWLKSGKRRFFNGIELAPNGRATPGYYNMWRGFAVEPQRGKWDLFQKHLEEIICGKKDDIFEYVLSWMAKAVQKPGYQANTAIALRGGQGTGKGAFVRGFGALFGVHFVHLDSTRHLTGNFNAHLHNAILVFADEAAWPGDKAGLGALKRLVTEPTLSIERKGMDIMSVPNMIHLLLASNEEWVVPAAIDERRFVVLDVDKSRQQDTAYFAAIEDELFQKGGLAAMLQDLLDYKISVDLRIIPKTEALYEQKRITSNIQRRWWYQVLYDGDMWRNEVPGAPGTFRVPRQLLYDNYVSTLDRAGARMKSIQTELGIFLKKVMPDPYPQALILKGSQGKEREWIFPSLSVCRNFYDAEYGLVGNPWPEVDTVEEVNPGLDM